MDENTIYTLKIEEPTFEQFRIQFNAQRQMKLFRILDMSFSVYEPIANLLIKLKLAKEV